MRTAKEDWLAFPARDASRALALKVEFRSMMFRNITLAQTVLTLSDASGTVSLLSCLLFALVGLVVLLNPLLQPFGGRLKAGIGV